MFKGFTLIELLIVVAITSILVSFAYPAYQNYIIKARRIDGQSALLDLASRMEQYYFEHNTYQSVTLATNLTTDVLNRITSPEKEYILSITTAKSDHYALQATPTGAQGMADKQCQSFTLNSVGTKGITKGPAGLPTGSIETCW